MSAPKSQMLHSFDRQKQPSAAKPLTKEELLKLIAEKNAAIDALRKEQTVKEPESQLKALQYWLKEDKERLKAIMKERAENKPLADLLIPSQKAGEAFLKNPDDFKLQCESERERKKLMETGKFVEIHMASSKYNGLEYEENRLKREIEKNEKALEALNKDLQLEERIRKIEKEKYPLGEQLMELRMAERAKKESKTESTTVAKPTKP